MKWIIRGLAGLISVVVLVVAAALILPFVVDFNQFKPHIKAAVGDAVNADLEFSSARLTILTGLGVQLKDVRITHTDETFKGIDLFKVKDLNFRIELQPLLQKRLEGYVAIDTPEIIIASKGQFNNLASLPKDTGISVESAEPTPEATPETPEQIAKREAMIEQFKRNVVIRSFEITQARFTLRDYTDGKTKDKVKVEDLNISISNIGLEEDITAVISTKFDLNEPGMRVSGPLSTKIVLQINTEGSNLKQATVNGKVDLDQLAIKVQDAFIKEPGIPLNIEFAGNAGLNNLNLSSLIFNFHTIKAKGMAKVDDFQTLATEVEFGLESNDLKALGDVLPQHKDMLIGGTLKLNTEVNGMVSDLERLTAKLKLDTTLTGADLALDLNVTNAKAPVLTMNMRSNELNLDKLLGPFLSEDLGQAEPTPTLDPGAPPAEDFALTNEQKELLKDADMRLDINLKKIVYDKIDIDNLVILSRVKDLQANVNTFGLDIFDGSINARGTVDLAANPIAFEGAFDMNAVQVQNLVALVAPKHKEVILGKANLDLKLAGSGTTPETLANNLDGLGSFAFLDGQANGGSITEQLAVKMNGFIADNSILKSGESAFNQAEKLLSNPLVQKAAEAKQLNLTQKKQEYNSFSQVSVSDKMKADQGLKDVKGSLEIKDGRLFITSTKASDAGGMDFTSSIGPDLSLGGGATFTASNALKGHMQAQSKYAPLLFDEQGKLALDMTLSGTAMAPSVSVNFGPLRSRFNANAKALVEKEVKREAEKLKDSLLKGELDAAKKELAEKRAAAEKRLAEEKAEAKAKAEAEKKKAEAEIEAAKKRAEEERRKQEDEAKKKAADELKKKFGF